MLKQDDQPVISWVSDIKRAAFQLEATGVSTIDEDIIMALTESLPESFLTFIVALDSLPPSELTLDNVITRLLNKEVRQTPAGSGMNVSTDPMMAPKPEPDEALLANMRAKCPASEITCYQCGRRGHYQSSCPSPEVPMAMMARDELED